MDRVSDRKVLRYRIRRHKQGHMIVHQRWLPGADGLTPERWLAWLKCRS